MVFASNIVQQSLKLTDDVAKTKKQIVAFYDQWISQKESSTLCSDVVKQSKQTKYFHKKRNLYKKNNKFIKKILEDIQPYVPQLKEHNKSLDDNIKNCRNLLTSAPKIINDTNNENVMIKQPSGNDSNDNDNALLPTVNNLALPTNSPSPIPIRKSFQAKSVPYTQNERFFPLDETELDILHERYETFFLAQVLFGDFTVSFSVSDKKW